MLNCCPYDYFYYHYLVFCSDMIHSLFAFPQIEENSRALEYLGHGIGGSVSSLDSATASPAVASSDVKAEKWKQGARKTLLNWVSNALPKYVYV